MKLVDPKIQVNSPKSTHNKTMSHTAFKKSPTVQCKDNYRSNDFKVAPLFKSKVEKSTVEKEHNQKRLSKLLPKANNLSLSHNQSATLKHSKGLGNTSLNSSAKINYNRGKPGTTDGSRSELSGTIQRQQKSTKPRVMSPHNKSGQFFNSTYNLIKQTSPASYSKKAVKKPTEVKKSPLVRRNDIKTGKNFKLEYLKDEKLSKLSESQLGTELEETRKFNSTSKIFMSPQHVTGAGSVGIGSPSNKLQRARMTQNLMNNVRMFDQLRLA